MRTVEMVENIMITPAHIDECDQLIALEEACFDSDPMSHLRIMYQINNSDSSFLVATINGNLAGYALAIYGDPDEPAQLYSLGVAPEYRKKGVATELLTAIEEEAIEQCSEIYLAVRENNRSAQNLYRKCGYHKVSEEKDYYNDGSTAIIMEKEF